MSVAPSALVLYAGGECLERYGVLVKRTSPAEDVPETFTRTGTATYQAKGGLLKSATDNVPRVSYLDLDGSEAWADASLLLEGARTNAWSRSEELDNAVWTKSNATITTDGGSAPDGQQSMDRLTEDATAGVSHSMQRNTPTLSDDNNQVVSFFAKAAGRTWLAIRTQNKAGTDIFSRIDLTNGVVGTVGAGHTVRIRPWGDGSYRVGVAFDAASGGSTPFVVFYLATGDGTGAPSYDGNGSSGIYLWGMQFEVDVAGTFATSYVKTVAAAVARGAESFHSTFNPPPQLMTIYLKFVERGTIQAPTSTPVMHIGGTTDTTDPRLMIRQTAGIYRITHDNGPDQTASFLAVSPVIGDLVELRAVLFADGSVQIHQSINSAAEVSAAASSASSLSASWARPEVYLNTNPGAVLTGFIELLAAKIALGNYSMAEMRAAE